MHGRSVSGLQAHLDLRQLARAAAASARLSPRPSMCCPLRQHSRYGQSASSRASSRGGVACSVYLHEHRTIDGALGAPVSQQSWFVSTPPARDPHKHATSLCRVLGVAETQLMAMVQRFPALFAFSPEALEMSVQAVASLTGLQASQVAELLAADPSLLLQPDTLKCNVRQLAQALGVQPQEVKLLAVKEPQILALSGAQAEQRLAALATSLRASAARVVEAVLRNPTLLVQNPAEVEEQLKGMQLFFGVGPELVAPVVLAKPSLLSTPPQLLGDRLQHLERAAGLQRREILSQAAEGPDLLAVSSCFFDRRVRELCGALRPAVVSEREAAATLVSAPRLLGQPVGTVISKWQLIDSICARHPAWAARLQILNPAERAALLTAGYVVLARLRFLNDVGAQQECDPLEAIRASDVHFEMQYPGFRQWMRA